MKKLKQMIISLKNKIQKTISILLILMLLISSCEKWLDVNDDPNNPVESDLTIKDVFPAGVSSVAYVMGGKYQVLGSIWSQHYTQAPGASQYAGIDQYDLNSGSFDGRQFGELYSGALSNLEFVRKTALKNHDWGYHLAAVVMQCYTFQLLADLYDQVPFSQALKSDIGLYTPEYENGIDIYDSLITRIDHALDQNFNEETVTDPLENDLIFNGDIDDWIRFANSLKLKIFLRQCYIKPQKSEAGIREMFENEVDFLDRDAKSIHYYNTSGQRNPFYDSEVYNFGTNFNLILSYTLQSYLEDNNDFDRLDALFSYPEIGGGHNGLLQGEFNSSELESGLTSSSFSKPIVFANDPVYLLSYSESCFLQAEAILRYNLDSWDDANQLYQSGVESHYQRLNVSDYQSFTNGGEYSLPEEGALFEDQLKMIMMQKWVSMVNSQALEAYFEHNRTGYPVENFISGDDDDYKPGEFMISLSNVTSNRYPKRLLFTESEYATNPNTPPLAPIWEKVWWHR